MPSKKEGLLDIGFPILERHFCHLEEPRSNSTNAARRASAASRPPPSSRSSAPARSATTDARASPASAVRAVRAVSSNESAIAAWLANSPSSSISWSENRERCGRSSTCNTPRTRSSSSSGTAISPLGTYPVSSATSRAKRGSDWTSSSINGVRDDATQPAMPVDDERRRPTRNCSSSPATAAKTSSSASSSSRKIDDALAPKIARATSTTDRSRRANSSSEPRSPDATAARKRSSAIRLHVRRGEMQHGLQLERRQVRMLAEDERDDAGDARRREAVARRADRPAAEPRDVDVEP